MDFHSLSRKDLQALCKKNKIPANMTNVAMAEALKDLQIVEGLDEIMNQSQINTSRSPGNPSTGSQEVPHSTTRTSTRRKPTKEEPQSSQPTNRTRRAPRRAITQEMDQENKTVNVPETPEMPTSRGRGTACQKSKTHVKEDDKLVGQGKSYDIKTPAVQSSRRRAPSASSRTKAEERPKEEGSVQCTYSTRRSVRLLDKSMTELSLKEKGTTEPVKIDESGKEMAVREEKNDASEADLQTISEESSERTNDFEIFSRRNLSESLENERDFKDDMQETDKSNNIGEDDFKMEEQACHEKSDNLNGLSVLEAKDSTHDEKTQEFDFHVAEDLMGNATDVNDAFADEKGSYNLDDLSVLDAKYSTHVMADEPDVHVDDLMEKSADMNGAFAAEKGSDDIPVAEYSSKVDNLNDVPVNEKDLNASENILLDDVSVEVSDHVAPAMPQEIDNLVSEEASGVLISSTLSSSEDQDEKPDSQCHKLGIEEAYDESMEDEKPDSQFQKLGMEEAYGDSLEDEKPDSQCQKLGFEEVYESMEDEKSDGQCQKLAIIATYDESMEDDLRVGNDLESKFNIEEESCDKVFDEKPSEFIPSVTDDETEAESFHNDLGSEKLIAYHLEKAGSVDSSGDCIGDQSAKMEVYNNKALVDIDVTESEEYDWTSTDSYSPLDSSPISGKEMSLPEASETEAEDDITLAKMQEIANAETFVDVYVMTAEQTPTSVKQMSPTAPLVSGGTVTGGNQLSPFVERSISGQFPRPTLLTATKSSSQKHTTIQNLIHVSDNNKENINNSERKVEPKMIKKNIIDGDSLKGISLRQLTKMVKELEITNNRKNNEEKMVAKLQVGKSRRALQTLPENRIRLPAAKQEKEN